MLVIEFIKTRHSSDGIEPELVGPDRVTLVPDAPNGHDTGDEAYLIVCAGRDSRKLMAVCVQTSHVKDIGDFDTLV